MEKHKKVLTRKVQSDILNPLLDEADFFNKFNGL